MLKLWASLVLVSCLYSPGNSQDTLRVSIRPECTLSIHGKTNVNSFTCAQQYADSEVTKRVVVTLHGKNAVFSGAEIDIPVNDFDCGHRIMTKDFQEILETDKHPDLRIILHEVNYDNDSYTAQVTIRLAGVARKLSIPITVEKQQEMLTGMGECEVKFSLFNLEAPVKFMGMVKVREELNISFNINVIQIP